MTETRAMTSNRPYLLRAVHAWICDNGLTPHIVADAGCPGLQVPPQAINEGRVVLNLAPRAVAHLEMGNDAITFVARFAGASHAVSVPIAAVQAIYARENGQGMLLAEAAAGTPGTQATGAAPARPATSPLQAVPASIQDSMVADATDTTEASADGKPGKPRPTGKPSLHVVK